MIFTTHIFLFYALPLLLAVYYALPFVSRMVGASDARVGPARNLFLLVTSYVFYGWSNPWFVLLMFAVTMLSYAGGQGIARSRRPWARRGVLVAVVTADLVLLGIFKYLGFVQANVNEWLTCLGRGSIPIWRIALPLGISFYTFRSLSYLVDVHRDTNARARSVLDFAFYMVFFPQVLAGPIVRYGEMASQLMVRAHTLQRMSSGVALFVLGFAKKILLADSLAPLANAAFGADELTTLDAWFGAAAYTFQIYFDFSGYSDMAIGLGRMVGFDFARNFNAPYLAESITDFWHRWHISLSTFLRDYLYFPLGGNRRGRLRTLVNLMLVMLLGGLWHGANWTFVAWGGVHGLLLVVERALGKRTVYGALPRPGRVGMTFVLVLFSWVFFRCDSLDNALEYFRVLFGGGTREGTALLLAGLLYTRGALLVISVSAILTLLPVQAHDWAGSVTWAKAAVLGPLFVLSVAAMLAQSFSPFLYFQF